MMQQMWNRFRLFFAHGVGTLIGADYVQVKVLDGETLGKVKRVEPYGFSYRPKSGCQAYMFFPAGDRSYGVALVLGDKQYQVDLKPGEVALHDDQGQMVHLTRDGIVVKGAGLPVTITDTPLVRMETERLEVTGDILDNCDTGGRSMQSMREVYDIHTHPENDGGGPTDEPVERMG